jgi:signal peptidase I
MLLLVAAAAVALVTVDGLFLKKRRAASGGAATDAFPWLVSQARALLPVILIVLLIRSFVFEPFRIPSASMMPGLVDGDFIYVSKFSYGLRLPVLNTKILAIGEPRRGDVIVFRLPSNPSVHYIKRLIGLPGDRVVVRQNQLYVNDISVPLKPSGTYSGGYGFTGAELGVERLDAGDHVVMFDQNRYATDFESVVPAGHYFFMGDNRNDSKDSRFGEVGFVPERNIVGQAKRIWLNLRWFEWPRWDRIGAKII